MVRSQLGQGALAENLFLRGASISHEVLQQLTKDDFQVRLSHLSLLWIRYLEAKGYVDLDLFVAGCIARCAQFSGLTPWCCCVLL
jgi:hypothetical protein